MARIKNTSIEIDDIKTHDFFEGRIKKKLYHRYNLVNYQDDHPQLALERDCFEKKKILPLLEIKQNSRVIDIGCGVGRWGDEIVPLLKDGIYLGVDYSKNMIDVAKKSLQTVENERRKYYVGTFQNVIDVLDQNNIKTDFDVVIVNGVLMYINDIDIEKCIGNITRLTNNGSCIYIKESVGITSRYTLKDVYSEELSSQYNAIYRGVAEYFEIFDSFFGKESLVQSGETFEEERLINRKETTSFYWIYKV